MDPAPDRYLLWGAGGHAKVVASLIMECGGVIVGHVGQRRPTSDFWLQCGFFVEEAESWRLPEGHASHDWDHVALGVGDNQRRLEVFAALERGHAPLIHPRAIVDSQSQLGDSSIVLAGSIVQVGAQIGRAAIINSGAIVEHDCILEDGVHLSPGAVLTGGVKVGRASWIGAGAVVLPSVSIGEGAVVGAGAVVVHDVRNGDTVTGVPARPIATRG